MVAAAASLTIASRPWRRSISTDTRACSCGHPSARWLYVLAHGAGAGMRHAFLEDIAAALAACGVATLRWELPYMAAGRARPDPPAVAHAAVRAVWAAARARFGDLRCSPAASRSAAA